MLVLVTRPADQAAATAAALVSRGHRAIIDPVIEIRPRALPAQDWRTIGAVAITSANAAHALIGLPPDLPVFAVGASTAEAVAAVRGGGPETAQGDGRALAELIVGRRSPGDGAVLHLAGSEASPGLGERLAERGFDYRRVAVYEAVARTEIGCEARAAIEAGEVGAVLLYSPRSARLWAGNVVRADLAGRLRGVLAACLSPAVAEGVAGLDLAAVRVAPRPDGNALLRLLEAPW